MRKFNVKIFDLIPKFRVRIANYCDACRIKNKNLQKSIAKSSFD